MKLLFEPCGLGDAVIATSVARCAPQSIAVACDPDWHEMLSFESLLETPVQFVGVRVFHGRRSNLTAMAESTTLPIEAVLSIRGDFRDFAIARRWFPNADPVFRGWLRFAVSHSALLHGFFVAAGMRARNRYEWWAELAEVPFQNVCERYVQIPAGLWGVRSVLLHVGAQYRSKQYPLVQDLKRLLESSFEVRIAAGPMDPLPEGLCEEDVTRVSGRALVDEIQRADVVIANDSGPMHLGAFLGKPTCCVSLTSSSDEWRPPRTLLVRSHRSPERMLPLSYYRSDDVYEGWPTAVEIMRAIERGV